MKKFIYSCLFLAMAAITFSSCEDVPAPYNMPTEDETPEVQPAGTGTAADPFNVAGAVKYIEDGGSESELKYVKGKVVSIEKFDASYGSMKYYISDDGTPTNQFYVFNGYAGPNRTKFSGADALKAGDEVVICGNLIVYSGTKEFQTGNYIVSLNGVGGATTPDTPTTGKGSESNPYTVAEAIAAIKAGAPTSEVYVTGIVSDVYFYNDQYKSLSYYISDDGKSKDMQVYSGKGLNGADFTSKNDLKVGQKVTIKGIIKSFTNKNGTEIMEVDKNSTITKIEGEGTGGEVTPKPDTPLDTGNGKITFADDHRTLTLENSNATAGESVSFDFTAQNYENQTDMTTIKLSDGTTITFDANGEKNGSKYYTSGTAVRVYKNNKIIVKGTKEIAKIIFHCNAPYTKNGETVNCDGNETATINFSGKTATYTNVFTGTTGGGVQLRFSSIEIVYAK